MVVRPDKDVERALKAFGDLSLKYRSFGAMPLRLGNSLLMGSDPRVAALDDMPLGPAADQPVTAAAAFPLIGTALAESHDVAHGARGGDFSRPNAWAPAAPAAPTERMNLIDRVLQPPAPPVAAPIAAPIAAPVPYEPFTDLPLRRPLEPYATPPYATPPYAAPPLADPPVFAPQPAPAPAFIEPAAPAEPMFADQPGATINQQPDQYRPEFTSSIFPSSYASPASYPPIGRESAPAPDIHPPGPSPIDAGEPPAPDLVAAPPATLAPTPRRPLVPGRATPVPRAPLAGLFRTLTHTDAAPPDASQTTGPGSGRPSA